MGLCSHRAAGTTSAGPITGLDVSALPSACVFSFRRSPWPRFVVLLATRSCTGMGSNRAARSARYLLSACALVVSHATAFLSQITFDSLLSRGLSTTKRGTFSSLAVLICRTSPSPRFFQNRQPTPSTSRIPTPSTFVFNCVCYLLPLALRSNFFLHSGPWIEPLFAPCLPSPPTKALTTRHPPRHP